MPDNNRSNRNSRSSKKSRRLEDEKTKVYPVKKKRKKSMSTKNGQGKKTATTKRVDTQKSKNGKKKGKTS